MSKRHLVTPAVLVTLIGLVAFASHTAVSAPPVSPSPQATIQYGVLTVQTVAVDAAESDVVGIEYRASWRSNERQPIVGISQRSEEEAFRALISRLGGNTNQSDLAGLLNTLAAKGWQLVESETFEFKTIRIFRL